MNITRVIQLFLVPAALIHFSAAIAQQNAKLRTDVDSLVIGDQINLAIEYYGDEADEIIFPNYTDTISNKIYIVKAGDVQHNKDGKQPLYYRNYVITCFDTGFHYIRPAGIFVVNKGDTIGIVTDSLHLKVLPYVMMDTVHRDTVKASFAGIVVFGRNNFESEINQVITDSIVKSVSEERLKEMRDSVRLIYTQQFASELYRNTGFRNDAAVVLIAAGALQSIFIIDRNEILESFRIPGANDTVFVQEYDTVAKGDMLFVTIDVKNIDEERFNTPLTWAEFWWMVGQFIKKNWWWLLITLASVLTLLYFLFFRKKNIRQLFRKIPIPEPAHQVALRELERIRNEKKWQSGKYLEFYSELTEVLRRYIESRFGVFALEMTSDQTLDSVAELSEISQHQLNMLRQILYTADTVKFAKAEPLFHENDQCLKYAFELVESTIETVDPEAGKPVEAFIEVESEKSEEDQQHV